MILKNKSTSPVVVLSFANEQRGRDYLRDLPKEYHNLVNVFSAKENQGEGFELVHRTNSTYDSLLNLLQSQRFQQRIVFFHFGGHAGNDGLLLEDDNGTSIKMSTAGLVHALSLHRQTLKFVFLNACNTQQIGEALLHAGIPVVLGTRSSISDQAALKLASRFYQGISENLTVQQAWNQACQVTQDLNPDSLWRDTLESPEHKDESPWMLMKRADDIANEALSWTLSQSTADELLGLPALPDTIVLPPVPFQYLQSYTLAEARIFWGRNRDIRTFFQFLHDPELNSVLLLHGLSGVGKSSFLQAGVLPRLNQEQGMFLDLRKLKRKPWPILCEKLGLTADADGHQLGQRWREWEAVKQVPLFIMIDQFEQIAYPELLEELEHFCQKIHTAFEVKPLGKLVLSFRKEYLSEIDYACKTVKLPVSAMTLGPLSTAGIIEVVNGVASLPSLKHQYKVEIEPDLGQTIAHVLRSNPDLPLTPVLQIIMSKLWEKSRVNESEIRLFSLEMFNELSRKGLGLDVFLEEQLRRVAETCPAEVETGLAIDVLQYHTSSLGTCQTQNLTKLQERYDRAGLELLLSILCETYLLVESSSAAGVEPVFSLAHDTLGPIVQQHFNRSNTTGQGANRLVESLNMAEKLKAFQGNPENFWLNEDQIQTIENGLSGMRKLSAAEQDLLQQSKKNLDQAKFRKRRTRIIVNSLGSILVLALLTIVGILFQSNRLSRANALMFEASAMETVDPTLARALYQQSLRLHSTVQAWNKMYNLQRREVFYTELQASAGKTINAAAVSLYGRQVAYCEPIESGFKVNLFEIGAQKAKLLNSFSPGSNVPQLIFASKSRRLMGGGLDHVLHWWSTAGYPDLNIAAEQLKGITALALSPDEKWAVLAEDNSNTLKVFNVEQGNLSYTIDLSTFENRVVQALAIAAGGNTCYIALADGRVLCNTSQQKTPFEWHKFAQAIQTLQLSNSGKWLLLGGRTVELRSTSSLVRTGTPTAPEQVFQLPASLQKASFDEQEQKIILCDSSGKATLFELSNPLKAFTLRSKNSKIIAAEFAQDGKTIISVTDHGAIWSWAIPSLEPFRKGHSRAIGLAYQADKALFAVDDSLFWTNFPHLTPLKKQGLAGFLVQSMAVDPSGKYFILGSSDGDIRLLSEGGTQAKQLQTNGAVADLCAIHPNTKLAVTTDDEGGLLFWNLEKGTLITVKKPFEGVISSLAFDPVGQELFLLSLSDGVQIWNAETQTLKKQIRLNQGQYLSICVVPGKKQFYVGNTDGKIYLHSTNGQCLDSLAQHTRIEAMAYDPREPLLISASDHGQIYFWDLAQKQVFHQLGPQGSIKSLSLTPDGRWILAVPEPGTNDHPRVWWNDQVRNRWTTKR